jgi:cytochrome P450
MVRPPAGRTPSLLRPQRGETRSCADANPNGSSSIVDYKQRVRLGGAPLAHCGNGGKPVSGISLDQLVTTPEYGAFCRGELDDPYPLMKALRQLAPVHWSPSLRSWVVVSYEEVQRSLRPGPLAHDRIEVNTRGIPGPMLADYASLVTHVSNWLGFTDPPKHTHLREIGRHLVNPAMAQKFRPWTASFTKDVVAGLRAQDHFDLVEEVALRLPLELICAALGIPEDDVRQFYDWSSDLGLFAGRMSPDWDAGSQASVDRSMASWLSLDDMFHRLMKDKRTRPADDVLTELTRHYDEGTITEDEVIGLAVFILAAGHGTSRNLIANSLYLLLNHPDEAHKLAGGPEVVARAVEEVLRYESPIPMLSQLASQATSIGGRDIFPGDTVLLHLGSANRDPERFERPEIFDVGRTENRHLAFGFGAHFCLGAPLARQTATVLLEELQPHLSQLILEGPPRWKHGDMSGRALVELPASWR